MNNTKNNVIMVTAENGGQYQAEVLDIFNVNGYDGKEYIMYSFGESVDADNEKVYVSILEEVNNTYNLKEISDENEWNAVQQAISEIINDETNNGGE